MTNLEFVEKVKQIASEDTAFAFGAYGEIVNDGLFVRTVRNQSERYHDKSNLTRLLDCYGKKAYECTALITEPLGITRNEGIPNPNNLYELWSTRKWLIEDMPECSGRAELFHPAELVERDIEEVGESGKELDVGADRTGLPAADRLSADSERGGELFLRESARESEAAEVFGDKDHTITSFRNNAIW